ncbi:MAG TPA: hypothetical protein VFK27_00265, partial [Bacillales bacterium]|nr:hypothetical protein [Bacillales bacterium]
MNVAYDANKHQISGKMSVKFKNNLNKTLNKIYFNLWPNADDFKAGGIKVANVQFNGEKADFHVDKTKLEISGLSFGKGEQAMVKMDFKVKLPKKHDRFGWYDETVSFGNWFPILAVFDNEG